MNRTVFFVSESTGITAETLGHSLLSQFDTVDFEQVYMPYINTEMRAKALTQRMQEAAERDGVRPIVFATMLNDEIRDILKTGNCFYMELFEGFVEPLSAELGVSPSRESGRSHAITRPNFYTKRIEAINFAMANDDGVRPDNLSRADVVLLGVSRSGKTPICLYLAMHYGLRAANYPITEEDFEHGDVPKQVWDCRDKLFALIIDPQRLQLIREERRPGSPYASLSKCQQDLRQAQQIFRRLQVPVINTTSQSIEEVSAQIIKSFKENQERPLALRVR
ncbi:kinase/pyrophosphorylase [Marichromatium gracile]|uniref:Putative phosphoenolpyruvate synthase regulatory protein n=2 Tax=Marichromatium TaxID=85076 RepID=W0E370_MARPU|nr:MULTISPECIES: pyruvate, water dikinase regulatory protein [Marichromatium]MBO8086222.1 kinase/pyrophosphorylase [Marichromatium sp.]AHF03556.1 PEP synthetase regulatory protein [Marichromatium purpuratum 984]KXX65363.1 phosphoenolpyruvate synthase regulatory protein [Marichromatium gracile]MBK1708413.1 kinase/pyrophosphorylase [Marichromatium gracile]MCF1183629.1 kinase/pyrophosphorylase [Marichromatium gracile]